ncbi:hypothetical protein BayCH28_11040 [Mycolicibacterium sp. CH28]|uniref:hypothetical protein n=1 Tax=Mycolicibacterium sp. CH28 TaxID=2512237 RepID=UPI001082226E|nr:hypothetical protein [Mycolicibacterium sp. CH28]TGD88287.1 hypothetical protein BayCH28_11040 [Mycolicibacterium sp. CH28]
MSAHDALQHAEASTPRSARLLAWLGAGGVLAAVGLVIGVTVTSGASDALPVAQAAPTSVSTSTTAASPSTSASTSTTGTSGAAAFYQADSRGYLNTGARCDENQTLMAYGRTARSLMAICVNRDGGLEYRGVRLSDGASLHLAITRSSDGTLIATNDNVTYAVSPTQFLVSEGDNVIYRDSWIEFKQPTFSESSSTSASATTTVSTTTVTVTTSVTPTTSKSGG